MFSIAARRSNRSSTTRRTPLRPSGSLAMAFNWAWMVTNSMYGGPTLKPISATMINNDRPHQEAGQDNPFCPCMRMLHPSQLMNCPILLRFVEIPPDQKRLADDVGLGHEPPIAAVAAAVPVVPHQEVVAGWHGATEARVIVGAIFPEWKRAAPPRDARRGLRLAPAPRAGALQAFRSCAEPRQN